jgi:nicotinate-nucleotide adenylyltransferase
MARLGVFGGTFDPPHVAHLILAAEARHQLGLDRVLWVLTPDPPHKADREITPWEDRLTLLESAISADPAFELSRVEIDRPSPHYAFQTMRLLRESYPGVALVNLMGGDELRDLPRWKQPMDFIAACDEIGVLRRPGDMIQVEALEQELPGLMDKVRFLDVLLLPISASEIRRRAKAGEPFRYFVPEGVYREILRRGLYSP